MSQPLSVFLDSSGKKYLASARKGAGDCLLPIVKQELYDILMEVGRPLSDEEIVDAFIAKVAGVSTKVMAVSEEKKQPALEVV